LGAGLVPFFFNAAHAAEVGLIELAFTVTYLALKLFSLALSVLQAGVLVRVDLREARQLGAGLAQLFFELVAAAAFSAQRLSTAGGGSGGFVVVAAAAARVLGRDSVKAVVTGAAVVATGLVFALIEVIEFSS